MPRLSVVAIPVQDEAERIGRCLAALSRQSVPVDHIVLLLNNCTDHTAEVGKELPRAHHRLHIIECNLDESLASAGFARALAMKHAASVAASSRNEEAVILTTDADAEVPENWMEANLRAIEQGADAVCDMAVDEGDLMDTCAHAMGSLLPGGQVLLVNYTEETDDPLSGDSATSFFIKAAVPTLQPTYQTREPHYRLDLLASAG